ncbi:hypothetical protein GCK72_023115 [Caenorhabditis remanei]|uniref:Uncharacterized protein n=1 Tax=Caenorhabditis remanei TaxID=31234 RepID=A0A6A5FVL5_CAERE|nr:hypothetical protein GCK72_023115 [Caenorhabditis remanei]KAF1746658.1 hypothetical protein GCK72_023115 [Caenorhabditis remanei]
MVPISPLSKDGPSSTPLSSPWPTSRVSSPPTPTPSSISSTKAEREVAKKMLKSLMEMIEEEEFISLLCELGLNVKKDVGVTHVPLPPPVPSPPPVPADQTIPPMSMTAPPPPPPPPPIPIAIVSNWKQKGRKSQDQNNVEKMHFMSELAMKLKTKKPQLSSAPRVVNIEIGSVEESPQISLQSSQSDQKQLETAVVDGSLLDTPVVSLLKPARSKKASNSSLLDARDNFEAQKTPSAGLHRKESSKLVRSISRKPSVRRLEGFHFARKKFETSSATSSQTYRPRRQIAASNSTPDSSTAIGSTAVSSASVSSTAAISAASYRRMQYAEAKTSGQLPPPPLSSTPSSVSKILHRK